MTRPILAASAALVALGSSLALAQSQPEVLLPPGFEDDEPAPTPTPTPTPTPRQDSSESPAAPGGGSGEESANVSTAPAPSSSAALTELPSLEDLEDLSTDELDELLGLKPRYDIPPAARRAMERIGVIGSEEGGLPAESLKAQPAALVRAAIAGTSGQFVSRWGHILLRRALASRLSAPDGMDPVEFTALRAGLLNRMGEHAAARAVVQDVDTANYNEALTGAALDAYLGTADIVGACPAVRLSRSPREDGEWRMLQAICNAYAGESTRAGNDLRRILNSGSVERIDALLAQRYAGAAGEGRRAVNIEWDGVEDITPWRFALANALGEGIPEGLWNDLPRNLRLQSATAPMLALPLRVDGAMGAAEKGILSSRALIDLFSQIHELDEAEGEAATTADSLREAYVSGSPQDRMAAIRQIWSDAEPGAYGPYVLTAYAAARMPANEAFAEDAGELVGSMLAAGLDRDAQRWLGLVDGGSEAWGILSLAVPESRQSASDGDLATFLDDDESENRRKSQFLVAGLAGLDRIESDEIAEYTNRLKIDLDRRTRWTNVIAQAAETRNVTLVALLAGLGMQGQDWDKMTPLHLFHIVRSLAAVGLEAEARMIAAEAVIRA